MECPSCENETSDLFICTQCNSAFCDKCEPEWDYQGEICSICSEYNTIAALGEYALTSKMRRWFSKKAEPVREPELKYPLPWRTVKCLPGMAVGWLVYSGDRIVFQIDDGPTAEYICRSANQNYQLCGLMVSIYNRIREGDAWFRGDEAECKLWKDLKEILK